MSVLAFIGFAIGIIFETSAFYAVFFLIIGILSTLFVVNKIF